MTTEINLYNWSGVTVNVYNSMLFGTIPVKPNSTTPNIIKGDFAPTNSEYLLAIDADGSGFIPYNVQTNSNNVGNLYVISNNQFPPTTELSCTNGTCNNYTYSGGYDQTNSYIIQGDYYSPANNYDFPTNATVVEVVGADQTRLTPVSDAFNPVVESGPGSSGNSQSSPSIGSRGGRCDQCSDCQKCPECSQCDDSSATWYWWLLGALLVLFTLCIVLAGSIYLYRRF